MAFTISETSFWKVQKQVSDTFNEEKLQENFFRSHIFITLKYDYYNKHVSYSNR